MTSRPTKAVRILGETLVLFRDALGNFGLIGDRCPHRRASLLFGMPDGDGLRCAYHGWRFDRELSGRGAWRTDLRLPRARAGAAATEVGTARRDGLAEGYRHDRCAVQLAADHGELHRPAAL